LAQALSDMPALRLFRRRWHFASDDLFLPGLASALPNGACAVWCAVVASRLRIDDVTFAWLICCSAACVVACAIDLSLAFASCRGSIFDEASRARVPAQLYVRMIVVILQVAVLVGCTEAVAADRIGQSTEERRIALGVTLAQWGSFALLLTILLLAFSCRPTSGVVLPRCRFFLKIAGMFARTRTIDDDSIIFANSLLDRYLAEFDMTFTDMAAALILVQRMQYAARENPACECEATVGGVPGLPQVSELITAVEGFPWGAAEVSDLKLSRGGSLPHALDRPLTCDHRGLLNDLLHYFCFATAVHGWMLHAYSGRRSMCRKVMEHASIARHFSHGSTIFSSLHHALNMRALKAVLTEWEGHGGSELVYLSRENTVGMTAYAVFLDTDRKKIVIALRGTLSLSDVVTDFDAELMTVREDFAGLPLGTHYAHRGMWKAARNVLKDIDKQQIFEKLRFTRRGDGWVAQGASRSTNSTNDDVIDQTELPDCSDYSLLVVGHSLGAGVGQILAALLREQYPHTWCFTYGTPAVWSEGLAEHIGSNKDKTVVVVLGDDVIPRLSVRSMEFLRDRLLIHAAHCPVSKWRVLRQGCISLRHLVAKEPVSNAAVAAVANHNKVHTSASPRFFHAGHIIYLRVTETSSGNCCYPGRDSGFRAEWASTGDFQEIVVGQKMIFQHFPDRYRAALEGALTELDQALPTEAHGRQASTPTAEAFCGAQLNPCAENMADLQAGAATKGTTAVDLV